MEKKKNIPLKIFKIFSLTLFYAFLGVLILFSVATLSRRRADQVPNLFGMGFLAVHKDADSMVGENPDSFNPGDLVFVKVLSDKQREKLNLEELANEGVVISFYDPSIKQINTHRVVEYLSSGHIRTQGDNVGEMDPGILDANDIVAIYSGKIPGFGKVINFMQSQLGFGIIVVLPMLGLLIYQIINLIINVMKAREEARPAVAAFDADEERERLRRELLEELRKEQEKEK